jgi:hypothetical protein
MMTPACDGIQTKIKKNGSPVFLMPFSFLAVLQFHRLKAKGVEIVGFCDNDTVIRGKTYCGCPIVSPERLVAGHRDAVSIVCSERYHEEIKAQLESLAMTTVLKYEPFSSRREAEDAVKAVDVEAYRSIAPDRPDYADALPWMLNRITLPEHARGADALVLPIMDVVITEKCSLRCRKCADLMQYFRNPVHMPLPQVKDDIDRVFANVDYVHELFLFGGESFLYKDLPEVMRYAMQYRAQYGRQMIITNGTVAPNEKVLAAMRDAEVLVTVSNYGKHSKNLGRLTEKLKEYGIPFLVWKPIWYEYQQLTDCENRDAQTVFDTCGEECVSIRAGKMYRCPFLLHGETLKAFPYDAGNCVVADRTGESKNAIAAYLKNKSAPPGCAFCSGYDVGNTEKAPVAEQAAEPVPYRIYNGGLENG